MTKRNRRDYTDEFKLEAIRLVEETDKTMAQVSRDLGIGNNLIGRWKRNLLTESSKQDELTTRTLKSGDSKPSSGISGRTTTS